MYADISQPPKPLPQADLRQVQDGIALLPPLSRRGHGPGLIILVPDHDADEQLAITNGVPSPLIKWAEEGFAVAEIQASALAGNGESLKASIRALKDCEKCDGVDKIGLVGTDHPCFLANPVVAIADTYSLRRRAMGSGSSAAQGHALHC